MLNDKIYIFNIKTYISNSTRPFSIKLGTVMTYVEGFPPTKSYEFQSRGHVMSRDKLETFKLHFHKTYKHET